jgi:hypothetical protein
MTGKVLKYEKRVEVDRGKGAVVLPVDTGEVDPSRTRLLFPKSSPNILIPNEQQRTDAVDAAEDYLYMKHLENTATEEDIRRGIFAGAFYMGMCAMAALMWFLGYFDVGV